MQAKVAKLLILTGFKGFPWTKKRRDFVEVFFSKDMVPIHDPFLTTHTMCPKILSTPTPPRIEDAQPQFNSSVSSTVSSVESRSVDPKKPSKSSVERNVKKLLRELASSGDLWNTIFTLVQSKDIQLDSSFGQALKRDAENRREKNYSRQVNIVKEIVDQIFENAGNSEDFRHMLSLTIKTGNVDDVINAIRDRLKISGLGHNLVPCISLIKKSTAEIMGYYTAVCQPERTFSGFRCNLVRCVQVASFMLCGTPRYSNLSGLDLRVDIWGDGLEVGGLDVTRMAFRIIMDRVSCQSSKYVFCFAGNKYIQFWVS